MNWKATAAVSGATVLVGWFAAAPPEQAASSAAPARPSSAGVPAAAADIQQQATRLQVRLRPESDFRDPERNLFRFGPKARVDSAATSYAPPVAAPAPVEALVPQPLTPIPMLAGVASDEVDGRTERTAILSSPAGVLLVREGDDVLGVYKVVKVGDDTVELLRLADGVTVRVALTP